MNPTEKALWSAESHLPGAVTLDDVAQSSGVTRLSSRSCSSELHAQRALDALVGEA